MGRTEARIDQRQQQPWPRSSHLAREEEMWMEDETPNSIAPIVLWFAGNRSTDEVTGSRSSRAQRQQQAASAAKALKLPVNWLKRKTMSRK
jgi:hypothetical protein